MVQIYELRKMWESLLDLKLKLGGEGRDDADLIAQSGVIEKKLSTGIVGLYVTDVVYSMRRLLPADLKVRFFHTQDSFEL